ncbi:glycosyltransferase family 9 protein [Phycisphaera mikurensis]|uniref:Glycosyltransferase n=1 Tax=Phycisphaera mikurensis (strain NBRC 102666 / KCTC 22515 / FYK2301M01) TaxID=1142394 RepID=I0IBY8_PHYMF|nr:glycosyltransferase family 9 protein [Phycisphaera mikurensis]MBB6442000.1 heptosyltransferase-2 [Phycisphaera mikurensis]BAM02776.1 glycosyltransferase [Phycisphaera mikurensis NBRC 102666]
MSLLADSPPPPPPKRLVVLMPTWFGDVLMGTPTLHALREHLPGLHLAAAVRADLVPLLDGNGDLDEVIALEAGGKGPHVIEAGHRLHAGGFDTAVLLPNSLRSAMLARLAGIPRRIGYERDGRGLLLTDRLIPRREKRKFVPVPTVEYYLQLARYLGAAGADTRMRVTATDADRRAAAGLGLPPGRTLVLNPGAAKPEKRWDPMRFAAAADALAERHGLAAAVTGAPGEAAEAAAVVAAMRSDATDLVAAGTGLAAGKAVMADAALLLTGDTGPRHLAAACGTPVVTLFGPTAPGWTTIGFDREAQVVARSGEMSGITVDEVVDAASGLLEPAREREPAAVGV